MTNLTDLTLDTLTATSGTVTTLASTTVNATTVNATTISGTVAGTATNSITAFAGGGQGSATALTTGYNRITTCATAADSVKLPAATAGKEVKIKNNGVAYASVFPATGEVIDTLSANTSVSLPAGGTISFYCVVAGTWESSPLVALRSKYSTGSLASTTFTAGQLTGAAHVTYMNSNATPGTLTTRTAAQMFTDDPYARVGGTYLLLITNTGAGTITIAGGSNVTVTGTATIGTTAGVLWQVTYTSATALTMQHLADPAIA